MFIYFYILNDGSEKHKHYMNYTFHTSQLVESMVNRQKLLRELGHNVSLPTIFGNRKTQVHNDQTVKRDLKIFDFQTIAAATDNFSPANRLGQGGFGPVYKVKYSCLVCFWLMYSEYN